MTSIPATETNGPAPWSISEFTSGAAERLGAINSDIEALRASRQQTNLQIKALLEERKKIERLVAAATRESKPRKTKTESMPADAG